MNAVAKVIEFPKPQQPKIKEVKGMYSDRFAQGYVMSSLLYRNEVWPFITDAARNVYVELENRINGYAKESDFISYSQLQGGSLDGSRKLGRTTVSDGLKELIKLGVISVVASGKQGMKSYQINEVSLKDRFTNKTSSVTRLVPQQDRDRFTNKTETSPVTGHTIDNLDTRNEEEESAQENFTAQNRAMQFIEYHTADRTPISLKDLFKKYPAQVDFIDQAKISFPNHTVDQIFSELQKMGQWSLSSSNHMPQKWMSIWLNWMQKIPTTTEQAAAAKRKSASTAKPQKPKYHQYGQAPAAQSIRDVGGNHE